MTTGTPLQATSSNTTSAATTAPTLLEVLKAPWSTIEYIPKEVREAWSGIFSTALVAFTAKPSIDSLTHLFLTSKVLLAAPRHGGSKRQEALIRLLQSRLLRWQANKIPELWRDTSREYQTRLLKKGKRARDGNPTASEEQKQMNDADIRRVIHFVDNNLTSRACNLLCSRGVVADSAANRERISNLFPAPFQQLRSITVDSSDYSVDEARLLKLISNWPRGLAPGPSGLRAEHLRVALQWGTSTKATAQSLIDLATQALSGALPQEIIPGFIAGRLVPLNEKDQGVRPVVIGEKNC